MLIFLADGQLGNQIFQYMFLKTIQKNNEAIIVSGFEELVKVFEIEDIVNLNKKNRWVRVFLFRIMKPLLTFLSDKSIVSSVLIKHERVLGDYRRESLMFDTKSGGVTKVTFVKLGFFQSESFFKKEMARKLKIKKLYLSQAVSFLSDIPKKNHKIFIHIRRGDYKSFTIYGESALLPLVYYKEQIEWFLENRKDCFFIFLSDEPEFIEKEFKYIDDKLISTENHFGTDLAIMTLCDSAILSPSSFGWWGSYLMKDRDVVFAPKYWLGFNREVEYHLNGTPCYAKEIAI
ncbi:MAG: alpha-1,2-fucosyltransferase [Methylococcales bacterium]|nr:alpha-1,2-fucosyltransferase [Methylococcales bacterium]